MSYSIKYRWLKFGEEKPKSSLSREKRKLKFLSKKKLAISYNNFQTDEADNDQNNDNVGDEKDDHDVGDKQDNYEDNNGKAVNEVLHANNDLYDIDEQGGY